MKAVCQGARPKELIADWSASLLDKALVNSGLVDAYELYDVLLNYWADVMQDDCYMIANDGWTYPEVKATRPGKGDKKKAIMYDEIVCDLLPVNILLAEYFKAQTDEIADLSAQIEQKQSDMDALVEQNEEAFTFDDETEDGKELSVKPSDVKKAIKNAKIDGTSAEDLKLLQQWLDLSNEKDALGKTQKTKRIELTDAVVAKYAALTEDEIKSLVVERKWLASIVDGCEALMQNVTHQIASDVTTLSERYETTLGATETQVKDLEQQVLQSLKEMGFTL